MTTTRKKDNFTDVVQIIQTPLSVKPKPVNQVVTQTGTVVTLSQNAKTPKK